VGEGVTKVKKGDVGWRVKDWSDTEIIIDGEQYCLMDETAILALV